MYVVLKWYFQWMKLQLHGCTFLLLPIVQKYVTCPNTRGHDQVLTFCLKFCSRLFSRTTRTRATRSWLLILKPSRASLFRACWSPSCTRCTYIRQGSSPWIATCRTASRLAVPVASLPDLCSRSATHVSNHRSPLPLQRFGRRVTGRMRWSFVPAE